MIRLLVADDHQIVRAGLRRLLDAAPDLAVVAEAGDGGEVIDLLSDTSIDVVLLDVSMPGPGFLTLMEQIVDRPQPPAVLVLSMQPEAMYGLRSLRAGAAGFVPKDTSPEELIGAIRRVAGGRRYVSADLAESLAFGPEAGGERPRHESLSNRELQVLGHLGSGRRVKEIAAILGLSPKTVSTYRSRILDKLGLESTADLIRYAIEHKLTD